MFAGGREELREDCEGPATWPYFSLSYQRACNSCELLDILGGWPNVHLVTIFKAFILPSAILDIVQKGIHLCFLSYAELSESNTVLFFNLTLY